MVRLADREGEQEAIAAIKETLAESTRAAVAASEQLLATARETIDVAAAARAADEHDRKVRQLRDIGQIAETIFWKAARDSDVKPPQYGWRLKEHNYLEQALAGIADDLPKCMTSTQANLPGTAIAAARDARTKVVRALQILTAERS